jgi:hypothetical protein
MDLNKILRFRNCTSNCSNSSRVLELSQLYRTLAPKKSLIYILTGIHDLRYTHLGTICHVEGHIKSKASVLHSLKFDDRDTRFANDLVKMTNLTYGLEDVE